MNHNYKRKLLEDYFTRSRNLHEHTHIINIQIPKWMKKHFIFLELVDSRCWASLISYQMIEVGWRAKGGNQGSFIIIFHLEVFLLGFAQLIRISAISERSYHSLMRGGRCTVVQRREVVMGIYRKSFIDCIEV